MGSTPLSKSSYRTNPSPSKKFGLTFHAGRFTIQDTAPHARVMSSGGRLEIRVIPDRKISKVIHVGQFDGLNVTAHLSSFFSKNHIATYK
jgi:hypothetical protein